MTRYNNKTVTVITNTGQKWNVSPNLLSKVKPSKGNNTAGSYVVLLISANPIIASGVVGRRSVPPGP